MSKEYLSRKSSDTYLKEHIMSFDISNTTVKRIITYIGVFVVLILFYLWKMDSEWVGNKQIHTLMELAATILALFVGIILYNIIQIEMRNN